MSSRSVGIRPNGSGAGRRLIADLRRMLERSWTGEATERHPGANIAGARFYARQLHSPKQQSKRIRVLRSNQSGAFGAPPASSIWRRLLDQYPSIAASKDIPRRNPASGCRPRGRSIDTAFKFLRVLQVVTRETVGVKVVVPKSFGKNKEDGNAKHRQGFASRAPDRADSRISVDVARGVARGRAVSIGVSVNIAPPILPVYVQPPLPAPGYLWTPGHWAWDPDAPDYYWVPGAVSRRKLAALWTLGYWGSNERRLCFQRWILGTNGRFLLWCR